jgi:hypothetical protein
MKNKTCGECRYYFEQADFCRLNAWECIEEDEKCCEDFEPSTNGDKIRQMSDDELAEKLVYQCSCKIIHQNDKCTLEYWTYSWKSSVIPGQSFETKEEALAATIEGLKKEYKG